MCVKHRSVVLTIIIVGVGQTIWSHHIEAELKLPIALCQEVVKHTSSESYIGVGEVCFVGHSVIVLCCIALGECLCRCACGGTLVELHQDDESPLFARVFPCFSGKGRGHASLVGLAACRLALFFNLHEVGLTVSFFISEHVGITVFVCPIDAIFIASELGTYLCTIS